MTAPAFPRATDADDVRWLEEIMGFEPDGEPVVYLARPSAAEPRLLLPVRPAPAAAAALRRLHGDRDLRGTLELAGGRLLGRVGLLGSAPGELLMLPPFELLSHLGRRLGEPDLTAAVTLGPPRRNRKPVLQLLRADGTVVGYAKVGWSDLTRNLVATEADILREVAGTLPNSVVAPTVIAVEHWQDRLIAVCSELRPPWRAARRSARPDEVAAHIAAIGAERRSVAELPLIVEAGNGRLGTVIDLDRLLDRHHRVELDTGLWHGDFTPWNMVQRAGRTYVWDWEFGGRHRPTGFDLLHHRFERLRRRPGAEPHTAVEALLAVTDPVLSEAGVEHRRSLRAAVIDLYLCELLARELALADQRWSGGDLARLGPVLVDTIERRLA